MKKKLLFSIIFLLPLLLITLSCAEETNQETKTSQRNFNSALVKPKIKKITWTSFKTTDKIPLSGTFTKSCIYNPANATDLFSAVNGSHFIVTVNSIFSDHELRDFRIENYFFKIMKNTEVLSGDIYLEDASKGYIDLKMNGITKVLPFTYTIQNSTLRLRAVMDITVWEAEDAMDYFLDKTYSEHKGEDGVSTIDNEVEVDVEITVEPDNGQNAEECGDQ
ncbi:hypothetical protein [Aureivirga marina]|uniref:hypothetical protein n=1 Tax=Aureivirga marina TaxID=1182451 RepID=UPI0018CA0BB2|nr:hypothetical protein [Aureivirga marina]